MDIKKILKEVKRIELKTKGLSSQVFSGNYKTRFKGRGMSFSEVRNYQYGDDVRNIDWNVTARTNEPHVKVFEEERELTFMFLIDMSASSLFGSLNVNKLEFSIQLFATLAFSANVNNDKVGAIFFSGDVQKYIPPKKGKAHIMKIIQCMLQPSQFSSGRTDLSEALKYLCNIIQKRCTAFILSDFICQGYEQDLRLAANRHDTIGIHLYDPLEVEIPNVGLIPVLDAESGKKRWVDTASPKIRATYKKHHEKRTDQFRTTFLKNGADTLSLGTHMDYLSPLIKFFKER